MYRWGLGLSGEALGRGPHLPQGQAAWGQLPGVRMLDSVFSFTGHFVKWTAVTLRKYAIPPRGWLFVVRWTRGEGNWGEGREKESSGLESAVLHKMTDSSSFDSSSSRQCSVKT